MNETFGQKSTVATIDGTKETLVFGLRYDLRYGDDQVARGVLLGERAANGDLVFFRTAYEAPDRGRFRVRPSTIDSILLSTDKVGVPDDAVADKYVLHLERLLGTAYSSWSGSDEGQRVLAAAAGEDRDARRGKVRNGIAGILAGTSTAADVLEDALGRGVALAESLASDLEFRDREDAPDAIAAEVARQIPELAAPAGAPSGLSPAEELALTATELASDKAYGVRGTGKSTPIGALEPVGAVLADLESRGVIPDQVKSKASAGRPYAERNQVWKCGTCKRRTRAPFCENGHPRVEAPAGKRREDRA